MGKTERQWRSDIARKLLAITGASSVEDAVPLLIDKKLSMFSTLNPPIDLAMVASAFGISSRFNFVPMTSAARLRPDGKGFAIDVNDAHNPRRQRFSIAHEIGHKALLDYGIRITKHRGSVEYTAEEREEEEICDAIAANILGLRSAAIHEYLNAGGFKFNTIEQVENKHLTSFEATLRAFLRYCPFPAAGIYCEMHGGLVGGVANQFIVRRSYHSDSFTPTIEPDCILSDIACLRDSMRQQGKIIANDRIVVTGHQQFMQAEAKRMTIYVEEQPKIGVVLLLCHNSG
jgi:hypothetical protein